MRKFFRWHYRHVRQYCKLWGFVLEYRPDTETVLFSARSKVGESPWDEECPGTRIIKSNRWRLPIMEIKVENSDLPSLLGFCDQKRASKYIASYVVQRWMRKRGRWGYLSLDETYDKPHWFWHRAEWRKRTVKVLTIGQTGFYVIKANHLTQ